MRSKPCRTPNFVAVAFRKAAAPPAEDLPLTMMHLEIACKNVKYVCSNKTGVFRQVKGF